MQTKMIDEERAARAVRLQARLDRLKVPVPLALILVRVCVQQAGTRSRAF